MVAAPYPPSTALTRSLPVALLALLVGGASHAQSLAQRSAPMAPALAAPLPFAVGEHLVYDAHAGPGLNGQADMWIDGPEEVRGTSTIVLHFTFDAHVGFLRVADKTTSWIDPLRMAVLRFAKEERHLLAHSSEDVAIEPMAQTWSDADGHSGATPTNAPLDELSFIYAVRTLPLPDDSTLVLNRHFDVDRSPTTLRSLGRGVVTTPAGTFATREVEMRVRDSHNYKGEGIIHFSLSDDRCRRPIRIESRIPGAGTVVLTLKSAQPAIPACGPTSGDRP
jgi:hypothetical protein